jgi:hypothetical protein
MRLPLQLDMPCPIRSSPRQKSLLPSQGETVELVSVLWTLLHLLLSGLLPLLLRSMFKSLSTRVLPCPLLPTVWFATKSLLLEV